MEAARLRWARTVEDVSSALGATAAVPSAEKSNSLTDKLLRRLQRVFKVAASGLPPKAVRLEGPECPPELLAPVKERLMQMELWREMNAIERHAMCSRINVGISHMGCSLATSHTVEAARRQRGQGQKGPAALLSLAGYDPQVACAGALARTLLADRAKLRDLLPAGTAVMAADAFFDHEQASEGKQRWTFDEFTRLVHEVAAVASVLAAEAEAAAFAAAAAAVEEEAARLLAEQEKAAQAEPEAKDLWKEQEDSLREMVECAKFPTVLTVCFDHLGEASKAHAATQRHGQRRAEIRGANRAWYSLLEFDEDEVCGRTIEEASSFKGGPLDQRWESRASSLDVLFDTPNIVVDDLQVVSYTGRSGRRLQITLSAVVVKRDARNVAFMCSITEHTEKQDAAVPPTGASQGEACSC